MGFGSRVVSMMGRAGIVVGALITALITGGCQSSQPGLTSRFSVHSSMIDFSGLSPSAAIPAVKVRASLPRYWDAQPVDRGTLFTHEQWKSPSKCTAVGVAAIRLPLPMSAKALVWFARTQYTQKATAAQKHDVDSMSEWTDALGREWFEGENDKYHVRGYVVVNGFDAWVVYSGYRRRISMKPAELSVAFRSIDSVVPMVPGK